MDEGRDETARVGDCIRLPQSSHNCREKAPQGVGPVLDVGRREVDIDAPSGQLSDSLRTVEPESKLRDRTRYVLGIVEEFDNNHLP